MSCSKLIDENCGTDAECGFPKTLLKCLSGKCSCRTSFGHYFDEEAAICRVHIGVTCHPGSKLTCEQEAECVPIPIPRLGKKSWCQCNANYPTATQLSQEIFFDSFHYGLAPCVRGKMIRDVV